MHDTDYIIEKLYNNILVTRNDKIVSQGLLNIEAALHSIWTVEGKNPNEFYIENMGVVRMVERDVL